ncbi:MAG: 6-bladed beta-propeller [Tannerellaceae bacterium]|nr:6-bladed beta-propeller [Tannerellaceae bacterium]
MNKVFYLLILITCFSCTYNSEKEKYQDERNNIVNVHNRVKEILIDDVLISFQSAIYMIDNYFIIKDYRSLDNFLHVFDKNNFSYITSVIPRGQGPNEITIPGPIVFNETMRKLYFTDFGKYKIFSYDLDSLLTNSLYYPNIKMNINDKKVPGFYYYINDTLSIGTILEAIGISNFKQTIAKWNMNTGNIEFMKYEHPTAEVKKSISFAVSHEHNIYVTCYHHHDLITICNFDGELKCNIYGTKWDKKKPQKAISYFNGIVFLNDKFITTYNGKETFIDTDGVLATSAPTKFIVFDINGNYIKTIETEYSINTFCYDKENNRIIMNLDDEIQFAYLELDGIV